MRVSWVTAFLDLPAASHDAGVAFWSDVTGHAVSPARGDHGEFATLVPPVGEPFLRTQRLGAGDARIHVDLHVDDPLEAAMRAVELGGQEIARPGYVVLASPGGLPFCLVHASSVGPRPPSTVWSDGSASLVDQVCLDLPAAAYDAELVFWAGLTEWAYTESASHDEFVRLTPEPTLPLKLLLQRLEEPAGPVRAHLDVAVTDRVAETARHQALGAVVLNESEWWTVLRDPAGAAYCLTDRPPYDAGAR